MCKFAHWFLGHHLSEVGKNIFLSGRPIGQVEWELHARPNVVFMIPLGYTDEALQDQVVVCIVPKILDGDVLYQTEVCPKDVVCMGPQLLPKMDHCPCLDIPGHGIWRGSKCSTIPYSPPIAINITIVLLRLFPSNTDRSTLKSPTARTSAPQGCCPITAMTCSRVEVLCGTR